MRSIVHSLLPFLTWRIATREKVLYLTFDDGPIPEVTPWVLGELKKYDAKATFFCVGDNVKKNPDVYQRILAEGHSTGNHTFHHVNGWMSTNKTYYNEVAGCAEVVASDLFRPPYGKIRLSQAIRLRKKYRIIMWDVLSKDYDQSLSGVECRLNVLQGAKPGSIVVFHDSIKAEERLRIALPAALEHFSRLGYRFEKL